MQKSYFGIDFGTTNTAVVHLCIDEYGTKMEYCSEEGMPFSSLLAINRNDGKMLFGRQVKVRQRQLAKNYHIFSSFKSRLGTNNGIRVGEREYTPVDITAMFLKGIKEYVKSHYELDIDQATFAIPVDFSPVQRKELKLAATAAGICVNRFISESTAAYMKTYEYVKGCSKVAVFDWGGGTLDISILEMNKTELLELAVHGKKLGGDDIDKLLARKIHADIAAKNGIGEYEEISDRDKDYILAESERAKIALSEDDYHRISFIDYVIQGSVNYPLELQRFKEIINPQISDAIATLYEAVNKAKISIAQLDAIIMVGGSCEMQPIQELMKSLFERKNIKIIFPEKMQWSVAAGAAMIDSTKSNYRLNQSLGVVLADNTFFPVIPKGTLVPCKIDEIRFGVVEDTVDAHFIFSDENMNTLKIVNVPIKGFTSEGLSLNATIDEDMIAKMNIGSTYLKTETRAIEINKIGFYYDFSDILKAAPKDESYAEISNSARGVNTCAYSDCKENATRGRFCEYHYEWEHSDSK